MRCIAGIREVLPVNSKKIRASARGEDCQIRIPGVCNFDPETTVLCHLPDGTGGKMGGKSNDLCSVYGCSDCHDEIDGRTNNAISNGYDSTSVKVFAYEGHMRTLNKFVEKGLV